jgi:hypothetical protein
LVGKAGPSGTELGVAVVWRQPVRASGADGLCDADRLCHLVGAAQQFRHRDGGLRRLDIGWLHTVREIPGFLAIGVIL